MIEGDRVTSRHLRSATELILLAPIKPGFVPVSELCSFSSRLHTVLETLYELRRVAIERDERPLKGPVERLQTIHRVQWTVLESERKLLVSAHFDRSWEDYFQLLVDINGPLLDLIFSHCENFVGYSCADGYDRFAEWIRMQQRPCDFLYTAATEQTLDDVRRGAKLAAKAGLTDLDAANMRVGSALEEADLADAGLSAAVTERRERSLRDALIGLYDLRTRFFSKVEELPISLLGVPARSGQRLFDDAVRALLQTDWPEDLNAFDELLPEKVRAWVRDVRGGDVAPPTRELMALSANDLAQIQGNVLKGYDAKAHGCLVLVRCDGAQQLGQMLRKLRPDVTTAQSQTNGLCLNVALTYAGLQRLGLASSVLEEFPKEFREGMEARAGLIGDVGSAHPATWERPRQRNADGTPGSEIELSAVDAVVIVHAPNLPASSNWPEDDALLQLGLHAPEEGRHVLHVHSLRRYPSPVDGGKHVVREHFGFSEEPNASSQPIVVLPGEEPPPVQRDIVNPGELILGYENDRGHVAACADPLTNPHSFRLFRNGTFMVVRKLDQDVAALNGFVKEEKDPEQAKARIIGRKVHGGEPLLSAAALDHRQGPNDFDFEDDKDGAICPLDAHMRLANPRKTEGHGRPKLPRIMRRGFAYGPRYEEKAEIAEQPRGLMFMAYNASIAGQYEVIQRWLNAGNPTGLSSAHNDLLSSTLPHTEVSRLGGDQVRRLNRKKPFVMLRWGMYLFMPSTSAIDWLAEQATVDTRVAENQAAVDRGRRKLRELDQLALSDADAAKREWKSLLEERTNFEHASDLWRAVHADGGLKSTPYGVLVASAEGAEEVLTDRGQRFSVREYWRRLAATTGPHYLAIDPEPTSGEYDPQYTTALQGRSYVESSTTPNAFLSQLNPAKAYEYAQRFLDQPHASFDLNPGGDRASVRVGDLARVVVARLSRDWLGLARRDNEDDAALVDLLEPFVLTSRYSFQPHPEPWVVDEVRVKPNLRENYPLDDADLGKHLLAKKVDRAEATDDSIGAIVGFAAPAIGCVSSVVDLWTEENTLAWHAQLLQSPEGERRLLQAILETLVRRPVPSILYRTTVNPTRIGNLQIRPGTRVIVSLSAAVLDTKLRNPADTTAWRWLFGGAHGTAANDGQPPHGCPAQKPAVGVLLGIIKALLERRDLRRERRGVLSYEREALAPELPAAIGPG